MVQSAILSPYRVGQLNSRRKFQILGLKCQKKEFGAARRLEIEENTQENSSGNRGPKLDYKPLKFLTDF